MGEDFSSIASKMISPEAELLIKYSNENIFKKNTIGRNVDKSFDTLENRISILKYLNKDDLKGITSYLYDIGEKMFYYPDKKTKKDGIVINPRLTVEHFMYTASIDQLRKMLRNLKLSNSVNKLNFGEFKSDEYSSEYAPSKGYNYNLTPMKFARYATDVVEFREDTGFEYTVTKDKDGYKKLVLDGSSKINLNLLGELKDISERAAAIRVLGQMLGINQSIKADPESLNKYFENIEVYFNKMMLERLFDIEFEMTPIVKDITRNGFSARKFALDEEYRNAAISLFDKMKYDINIYDVMANSLHFFEMFKAAVYAERAINNTSKRLRITNKIIDNLHKNGFIKSLESTDRTPSNYKGNLPKNLYTKLSRIASDIINVRFFEEKDIKVKLRNGDYEYDAKLNKSEISADSTNVNLSTYAGRRSFVEWFENKVIPDLKNGVTKNNEGIYNAEPSESLISNEFVRSLQLIIDEDKNTGVRFIKYTLPIKMTASKTLDEKIMFDTYAEHFRNLGETTYDGQSVTDLFYLYNLIINGNNVNNDSLTRIFESNFNYVLDSSKIKSHLRFIGDLDYNENNDQYKYLNYITDDVLVSSGIYSEASATDIMNAMPKQLPVVRKLTKDSNGVLRNQFFRFVKTEKKNYYRSIPINNELTSKYINTIDVNNALSEFDGFSERSMMLQKVSSNLISYKIKCE